MRPCSSRWIKLGAIQVHIDIKCRKLDGDVGEIDAVYDERLIRTRKTTVLDGDGQNAWTALDAGLATDEKSIKNDESRVWTSQTNAISIAMAKLIKNGSSFQLSYCV